MNITLTEAQKAAIREAVQADFQAAQVRKEWTAAKAEMGLGRRSFGTRAYKLSTVERLAAALGYKLIPA